VKILAINGSPRGAAGNTDVLVRAFLSGAREAGAETEIVYLKGKTIHHCEGCFSCWIRTPGVCIHDDDMTDLLGLLRTADVGVVATPLYGNMVTGLMKDFLDRTLPLSHPAIQKQGDQYLHPPRYEDGVYRTVLITNAGFPETHHFEGLKKTFEISASGPRAELAGMICCAGGPMLQAPGMEESVRWYTDATVQAGRDVVLDGRISPETQAVLDRPLFANPGQYAGVVNAYWRSFGVEIPGEKPASSSGKGSPLPPGDGRSTVRDLVSRLPESFAPSAAGDLAAAIQFDIPDEHSGNYYLVIENGTCSAFEGIHPSPRMTIRSPAEIWLKVCAGELDGATAFMSGQYQVQGDVSLLMQFRRIFSREPSAEAE
jgi:multimeric flavodoxin WrbA/putative sterol carrier protein